MSCDLYMHVNQMENRNYRWDISIQNRKKYLPGNTNFIMKINYSEWEGVIVFNRSNDNVYYNVIKCWWSKSKSDIVNQ